MANHALMKRGSETMNVPPEKVQQYLDDGWTIVQNATGQEIKPVEVEQPQAEEESVAEEEAVKTTGKRSKKG